MIGIRDDVETRNCFQIMCMRCEVFFVWIR